MSPWICLEAGASSQDLTDLGLLRGLVAMGLFASTPPLWRPLVLLWLCLTSSRQHDAVQPSVAVAPHIVAGRLDLCSLSGYGRLDLDGMHMGEHKHIGCSKEVACTCWIAVE